MAIGMAQPTLHMTWERDELILNLAPLQGYWTAEQYLLLTDQTTHLIEFTKGTLEVLPMPTERHQAMLEFLFFALRAVIEQYGGKVRFAPLRLQIRGGKFREPDNMLMRDAHDPRRQNRFWLGADLVVEIVSPDDPERDTQTKRVDYAEARIPEYWIVNPDDESITVLELMGDEYRDHGVFKRGTMAISALLNGFAVSVDAVLDAR